MEYYLSLLLFCVSSSITPGPNNLMMLMSGINFGVKRSLPHYFGILFGFSAMVFLVGMGLAGVFAKFPVLHQVIKYIGAIYMLYLAYQIIRSSSSLKEVKSARRPLSFFKAVLFQWVNPKAWVMGIGAVSAFTVINLPMVSQVIIISLIYFLVGVPCIAFWLIGGVAVRRYLNNTRHLQIFNVTMGILLIASILLMLFGE
ncbi:LysE family translocator [Aquella oligotrophica]|uniref:LysE family translocator n=1 Tax=Aquella oligotrophica TaxID=2067065 RepID=A0A2I7N8G7_9NEIS|nr:LysE family translocator [Aquella oligotrophica]AUR52740.1 LysE family translocator [Aquella oligotrophica]